MPKPKRSKSSVTPTPPPPPARVQISLWLRPHVRALLDVVRDRDGVPYTAQIERAIVLYAESKGISVTEAA